MVINKVGATKAQEKKIFPFAAERQKTNIKTTSEWRCWQRAQDGLVERRLLNREAWGGGSHLFRSGEAEEHLASWERCRRYIGNGCSPIERGKSARAGGSPLREDASQNPPAEGVQSGRPPSSWSRSTVQAKKLN